MKKSVKEMMIKYAASFSEYNDGEVERFRLYVPADKVMRIIRRACKEAYERGVAAVDLDADYYVQFPSTSEQRQAINDIINGPKKARGK